MKRLERIGTEGLKMIYNFAWEDPASMAEVTESLVNYMTVLQQLWPYDPTAIIMMRLINKYKWINMSSDLREKILVITTFFNSVLQDNAGRSLWGETVLGFKDQEDLLKAALVAHNLSSSIPASHAPRNDHDYNKQKSISFPGNFNNSLFQPNSQGLANRNNQPGGRNAT